MKKQVTSMTSPADEMTIHFQTPCMTRPQIARVLGISVPEVRNIEKSATRKLRKTLRRHVETGAPL